MNFSTMFNSLYATISQCRPPKHYSRRVVNATPKQERIRITHYEVPVYDYQKYSSQQEDPEHKG